MSFGVGSIHRGRRLMLAAPLLGLCFVGVYDGVLCVAAWLQLSRAAASTGAALAYAGITDAGPAIAAERARPADVSVHGATILSVLRSDVAGPMIAWQRGEGEAPISRYGEAGQIARDLPARLAPSDARPRLVVELLAPFGPWIFGTSLLGAWLPSRLRAVGSAPMAATGDGLLP